jgi:hypothetical protein
MGTGRNQPTTPDLFSAISTREHASASGYSSPQPTASHANTTAPSLRHILPKDLPNAITALTDKELDQLSAAILIEQQRRGKKPPSNENVQKRRVKDVCPPMSVGKMNAVRAAFKAGLKPSQIARQFRISLADVRKALAGESNQTSS